MNDMKSVFKLLLQENMDQKQEAATSQQQYALPRLMAALAEKTKLQQQCEEATDYVRELETHLAHAAEEQVDPEELEEILIELDSHKKAFKGLMNQYNCLERSKSELEHEYKRLQSQNP